MRINTRPSRFALVCALLLTVTAFAARARAQGSTHLFDAPWLSFDTGWFARGYEPEGFAPNAVEAADLDRDGDTDLVTANNGSTRPGFSVLMNAGDGNYHLPVFYYLPVDKSVVDVALADVDKDGDADVLATAPDYNGLSNILALWRNNGDGTFAPFEQFATGPGPRGMAVADFNGDGYTDVATANHGSVSRANNTFSVVLHNGRPGAAAGFLPHAEFTAEGMDAQRVAAADVNGDGRPDLAVAGKDTVVVPGQLAPTWGKIAVFINNGAGGFNLSASYVSYPDSRLPSVAVAVADLDKDGDADLIAGGMLTNGTDDRGLISIRRNAGNGTFGAPAAHVFESNVATPHAFALGDLNKDGYTDIIALTPTGRTMDGYVALLSDGAGGFRPAAYYEASQLTYDAAVFDADHDGDADVLTVAASAAAATVHRNNGEGKFPVLPRVRLGQAQNGLVGNGFSALEAGDLDRDGDPDLVVADAKSWIIRNNGDGSFAEAAVYDPPINPGQLKLRDLNGDGHLDLLFGPDRNAAPYHFGSSLNRGDGTFAPGTVTHVNACAAGSIDAADFDRDGDLDVVLTEEGACMGGPPPRVFIFRNDGRGAFTLATTILTACGAVGVGVGDFNHDGRPDFVANNCNRVGVWPGKGDLTFGPPVDSSEAAQLFKVADLDGDGRLDLAMILTEFPASTAVVGTALGHGDATFAAPLRQLGSSGGSDLILSNAISTADVDGDGDLDVLVANNAANDLSLFYNENGSGTLRRHERYGVGNAAMFAAAADYDGDGAVDVASGIALPPYGGLRAVVVLRNRRFDLIGEPVATMTSPSNLSTYETPASVPVAAEVRPVPGRSISKVEFYVSGEDSPWQLVHTDTTSPYGGFNITGQAPGLYHVYAVAYDAEGTGISTAVSYTVKSPAPTPTPTPTPAPTPQPNPIDDARVFVRQHYHDFLGREPDAAGLNHWAGEIAACGTDAACTDIKRQNVSAAFFLSIEFQETGYLAYRMHKAAFGDLPGKPVPVRYADFLADSLRIGAGVEVGVGDWLARLEANKDAYGAEFVSRPAFRAAYPGAMTPAEFVGRLNQNAGGALSPAERDALVAELTSGAKTRAQALRAVAEDQTLREAELRRAFVLMQYFGYLRRNPDDVGFDGRADPAFEGFHFWLGKLDDNEGNFVKAEMVKAFIISIEYRQRFGQ